MFANSPASSLPADPISNILSAYGLRRTSAARLVLGWLLAHPDTSYTHAQLQSALASDAIEGKDGKDGKDGKGEPDRVTLYRLVDRMTQVGLLVCRVDASRTRRYQAMPAEVHAIAHFECQSCHRDSPLSGALSGTLSGAMQANDLELAAQTALAALKELGYLGMSMDFAVRGVCADCAVVATA